MRIFSTKLCTLALLLAATLGGCKKHQKNDRNFTKTTKHHKSNQKHHARMDTHLDPLTFDTDNLQAFALDDSVPQHKNAQILNNTRNASTLSWGTLEEAADESKNFFKTLYFDFNKDVIKPSEEKKLHQNIKEAKKMIAQGKTIVIEGHACHSEGSAAYNMALSEHRACHVAKQFAKHGIDSTHIKIAPRGQEMPVRVGGSRKEQAVNRRVEIYAINSK
jgi:outer membrane protein OmpA-like peptidoglycan-associated protein